MTIRSGYALTTFLLAVLAPLGLYLYLRGTPHHDLNLPAPGGHFYVVSVVSLLAGIFGVIVGIAGQRLRNIQVSILSLAFTSLALVFMVHGLSTPGLLMPATPLPGVASQTSILLCAFWLWLSAQPSDRGLVLWLSRRQRWLVPVWVTLLVSVLTLFMLSPDLAQLLPLHTSPFKWVAMGVTLVLLALAARRYWQSYRFTRFPLQYAILVSAGWLADAQVILSTSSGWHLSWWTYHGLLLMATLQMLYGLVRQYGMGTSIATAVQGLFSSDPMERIQAGISPSYRGLIAAVEARDPYTAGHNYRVALYAFHIGEAMGLPPEHLRALAQGCIVHDVGKIVVPDEILNKPGQLTPEERKVIEKHPVTGYEMCKSLGFLLDELHVIRHHHERWDGKGYPDRLHGEEIPLLARIAAVADVYDALTSTRSYRKAWSHEEAMKLICEGAGTQFDPACVEAWVKVVSEDRLAIKHPA
jgi:HD-GYP domain-containing protein (c-di-GMP phosphodiesterase class II)